jgi:hypothetical protein
MSPRQANAISFSKRLFLFVILGTASIFLIKGIYALGTAQSREQPERLVEQKLAPNEPVKILAVTNKKGKLKIGSRFQDDEQWLRGLTLEITNAHHKPIQFVGIELLFPRAKGRTEPPVSTTLTYGQDISSRTSAPNEVKPLLPGQSVNLALTDSNHESLREILRNQGTRTVSSESG